MGREVTSSPRVVVGEQFFVCVVCCLWFACFARCAFTNLGIRILCLDRFVLTLADIHPWLVTFLSVINLTSVNFLTDLRRTGS